MDGARRQKTERSCDQDAAGEALADGTASLGAASLGATLGAASLGAAPLGAASVGAITGGAAVADGLAGVQAMSMAPRATPNSSLLNMSYLLRRVRGTPSRLDRAWG
jgi:hypothetical protein